VCRNQRLASVSPDLPKMVESLNVHQPKENEILLLGGLQAPDIIHTRSQSSMQVSFAVMYWITVFVEGSGYSVQVDTVVPFFLNQCVMMDRASAEWIHRHFLRKIYFRLEFALPRRHKTSQILRREGSFEIRRLKPIFQQQCEAEPRTEGVVPLCLKKKTDLQRITQEMKSKHNKDACLC
jgi:hypothetical protein